MASNTKQQVCMLKKISRVFLFHAVRMYLRVLITILLYIFTHGLFKLSVLYNRHDVLTDN